MKIIFKGNKMAENFFFLWFPFSRFFFLQGKKIGILRSLYFSSISLSPTLSFSFLPISFSLFRLFPSLFCSLFFIISDDSIKTLKISIWFMRKRKTQKNTNTHTHARTHAHATSASASVKKNKVANWFSQVPRSLSRPRLTLTCCMI